MTGASTGRGTALDRCLAVPVEQFAREHWAKAPLLSRAEALGGRGFGDLFGVDAVDELVARRGVRTPFVRLAHEGSVLPAARFTGPGGYGAEIGDQLSSDKVLTEFAAGATIVLQGLHRLWPALIDFTRRLVDELGHPAQVNAYVTPPSSRGFDPHYDTHDVFVLQVAGEKHWTIHAPVHPDPLPDQPWSQHTGAVAAAAREDAVIDEVLRPGDALYLPRGWIHSAKALGDTSVHLTVGIGTYTRADVVDAVRARLGEQVSLRTSLPMGLDVSDPEQLRPIVEEVVTEFVAALQHDAAGSAATAAAHLGARFERETRPEPVGPVRALADSVAVDSSTSLRLREALSPSVRTDGDRVRLSARGRVLALPASAEAALRRLATGEPVVVGDLPGLDEASRLVVARRLVREGFAVTEGR